MVNSKKVTAVEDIRSIRNVPTRTEQFEISHAALVGSAA